MRKERMNDKGFSLVELIIVIAIMAILLVVLAPQYLKYVERSRNSTDLQNATEIVTALQVYAADPEAKVVPTTNSAGITISDADVTGLAATTFEGAALKEAGLLDGTTLHTRCQSKTTWASYNISWEVKDGQLTFKYKGYAADGTTEVSAFKERMMGATTTPTKPTTPTTPGE